METWVVPLAALIVSLSTLIFGAISLGGKANGDFTQSLNTRLNDAISEIDHLKREVRECHQERAALQRREVELMRQLVEKPV